MPRWLKIEVRSSPGDSDGGLPATEPVAEGNPADSAARASTAPSALPPESRGAGTRRLNVGLLLMGLLTAGALAGGVILAPSLLQRGSSPDSVVARVNSTEITVRDVDVELLLQKSLRAQQGMQLTENESDLAAFRRDILDQLVDQALMIQAASAEGIDPTPEQAWAELQTTAPQAFDALKQQAVAEGVTQAELDDWARRQHIVSTFIRSDAALQLATEELQRRGRPAPVFGASPSDVAAALQSRAEIEFFFEGFEGDDAGDGVPVAREGEPAPDFTLTGLDGAPVSLSDFRGQPVMLNFWATWCGPCRTEMPLFVHMYNEHRDAGLTILAVDVQEPAETVQPFVTEFRMEFPIALDQSGQVSTLYRVRGLPTTMFIDAQGVLQTAHRGAIVSRSQLEDLLFGIFPEVRGASRHFSPHSLTEVMPSPRLRNG